MSENHKTIQAMEVNASMIGALFTDQNELQIRIFCFYLDGSTCQFDMPAEANRDSLHSLFARLDMVNKCTCIIQDKVVHSRIYADNDGEVSSYTLLTSPNHTLPPVTPGVCDLPWKVVWASPEAEVLELSDHARGLHCLAVRSLVSEVDLTSVYRSSHAFLNPVSPPASKQTRSRAGMIATAAMIFLAISIGLLGAWAYPRSNPSLKVQARPVAKASLPSTMPVQMLHEHQISGPFNTSELIKMSKDGRLPPTALFRVQGGADWISFGDLVSPAPGDKAREKAP